MKKNEVTQYKMYRVRKMDLVCINWKQMPKYSCPSITPIGGGEGQVKYINVTKIFFGDWKLCQKMTLIEPSKIKADLAPSIKNNSDHHIDVTHIRNDCSQSTVDKSLNPAYIRLLGLSYT